MLVKRKDGGYEGVLWNLCEEDQKTLEITLSVPVESDGVALLERVDSEHGNPLRAWHRMGQPYDLTQEQLTFLRQAAQPYAQALDAPMRDGRAEIALTLRENDVVRVRILPAPRQTDAGYDYAYYCKD